MPYPTPAPTSPRQKLTDARIMLTDHERRARALFTDHRYADALKEIRLAAIVQKRIRDMELDMGKNLRYAGGTPTERE